MSGIIQQVCRKKKVIPKLSKDFPGENDDKNAISFRNISSVENHAPINLEPLKKFSLNSTTPPQSQNHRQPVERSSIRFPNSKPKLSPAIKPSSSINKNSTLRSSKTIKVTSTTTPTSSLSPKLPKRTDSKVMSNNKIGHPANFPAKVRSGQLSFKSAPENLSARRALTHTKLVSDQYAKFKKPVLQRIASPVKAIKGKKSSGSFTQATCKQGAEFQVIVEEIERIGCFSVSVIDYFIKNGAGKVSGDNESESRERESSASGGYDV